MPKSCVRLLHYLKHSAHSVSIKVTRDRRCPTSASGQSPLITAPAAGAEARAFSYDLIRGCRWVDRVVEDVPYVTQLATIDEYEIGMLCVLQLRLTLCDPA